MEYIIYDVPNNEFWIISAGFKNRYRHPSYRVVNDIYLSGKKCSWVNEITPITIRGEIIW